MLADIDALKRRLGLAELSELETARAEAALEDASVLVTAQLVVVPQPTPDVVATIVVRAAERAFRNPTGAKSRSAIAFSESLGDDFANGVYLTDTEKAILRPYAKYQGLVSVPLTRPELLWQEFRVPTLYPDGTAGDNIPWFDVDEL